MVVALLDQKDNNLTAAQIRNGPICKFLGVGGSAPDTLSAPLPV